MARRIACLAMLDRQLEQLEMDRALIKRELMYKVDVEFDKLRTLTLKIKMEISETGADDAPPSDSDGPNSMSDDSIDDTEDQAETGIATDDQQQQRSLPSTSSRGRKRKSNSNASAAVPSKRSRYSNSICIYPGCGKVFSTDANLASHERTHTGIRPFTCIWPDCHFEAATRGDVVRHIRTVHLKLPVHKKDQRALNITDRRDPNRWIRVNQQMAKRRLTQADISSMMRKSNANVDKRRNRKKKSNNIGKYVCRSTGCGQRFQSSCNRLSHERAIHLKAKPYGCTWPDCGYVASRRGHVVKHVRMVHFGLPQTAKLQRQMSITDNRDPNQWVTFNEDELQRRLE